MHRAIDVHTHVVPEDFPPYSGRFAGAAWPTMHPASGCHRHVHFGGKHFRTLSEHCWSVERRLDQMDAMGIGIQALSPMPELLSYWLPLDDASLLIRYVNERIGEMIGRRPGRFVGLGGVPLQDVDSAIRELTWLMQQSSFSGVEVGSNIGGISIGDPRFDPFFEAASALNASIFVHALHPAGRDRVVGGFPDQGVCFPGEIGLAAASMITGGMAARYDKLKIAFSHGGGALVSMIPRMTRMWQTVERVNQLLDQSPTFYARQFYYDTIALDPGLLRLIEEMFGTEQMLLGSDYPFFRSGMGGPQKELEEAYFDTAKIDTISIANAERFLGLSFPPR